MQFACSCTIVADVWLADVESCCLIGLIHKDTLLDIFIVWFWDKTVNGIIHIDQLWYFGWFSNNCFYSVSDFWHFSFTSFVKTFHFFISVFIIAIFEKGRKETSGFCLLMEHLMNDIYIWFAKGDFIVNEI